MKKTSKTKRDFDYPDKTKGSKIARAIRQETNALSDAEREELFNQGMRIVHGGALEHEANRTGR